MGKKKEPKTAECRKCDGEGSIACPTCWPNGHEDIEDTGCCSCCDCSECEQTGIIDCPACEGTGEVETAKGEDE